MSASTINEKAIDPPYLAGAWEPSRLARGKALSRPAIYNVGLTQLEPSISQCVTENCSVT